MHELSLCDAIARAVIHHAGGHRVRSVRLRVGALRQVVPDALVFCWSLAARDPLLQGSVLDVEVVPAEVECVECGTRHTLSRFVLRCPGCQGSVSVVSGEELLVVSIDVLDEDLDEDPAEPGSGRPSNSATKE
ncbi:hydrogenase maturation nickel metallochaperone HypA [Streptomyces cavernae]|uniref:hydrogenase maturation nickel metallochaperone HypA/HybF n=1 Tax=Streptomyces cavernae TaxID=2259034 RepID=UPI000FEC1C89|nr:hydrogenase maturation nickel metallochaperone HypA [Streptomyces cavernae]